MRFSVCFLLIPFMVTIRPSDNFQITEEVKAQIEEANNKISPIANLITSSSQTINGLLQTLQSSLATLDTVSSLTGGLSILNDLFQNFKFQPFTPKTDANGNLDCLKNSEYNFCIQDFSYPKWYIDLIKPEVEKTITAISAEGDVYDCGGPPTNRIQCNTTFKTVELETAQVFTDKMNGSDSGNVNEFNFVLQTDSTKQLVKIGRCEPKQQQCMAAGGRDKYDCIEVGPPPNYPPARRSEDTVTNYVIVINQEGRLDAKATTTTGPCFCICNNAL